MNKFEMILEESELSNKNICNLLECDESDLAHLYDKVRKIYNDNDSTYDIILRTLQQGCNVREAALLGFIYGKIRGFSEAERKIEDEMKERLFNAFKNNSKL